MRVVINNALTTHVLGRLVVPQPRRQLLTSGILVLNTGTLYLRHTSRGTDSLATGKRLKFGPEDGRECTVSLRWVPLATPW